MAGPLVRIPQLIQKQETRKDNSTAASRVIDTIENNRELLKQMKKERINDPN
jgi:hypothetical protein